MVKLLNRAKMTISSTGTGNITLAAAVANFQTFAQAGASDGDVVRYAIEDNNGAAWEIGTAVMSSSATVMARTVSQSSNSGNALNLTSNAVVFGTLAAEDFSDNAAPAFVNTIPSTLKLTAGAVSTIDAKALDDAGFPVSYTFDGHDGTSVYSSSSLPPQLSAVSINQTTGVFSLTASTSASNAGSHTFRVRATDGVRTATRSVSTNLSFLPTSGLLGVYDMADVNSYAGSGTSWVDVSGNSGPTFTIDLSVATYVSASNGIGGIAALALDTPTGSRPVYFANAGLTNADGTASTAVLIFAHKNDYYYTSSDTQTVYNFMGKFSESYAFRGESGGTAAGRKTGTSTQSSWSSDRGAARSGSSLYIDKVDASSHTTGGIYTAISGSGNEGKYHSLVLTNGLFEYGFATSFHPSSFANQAPMGDLRAMVFYDRALSATEVTSLHGHFAKDYSSSEMVQ